VKSSDDDDDDDNRDVTVTSESNIRTLVAAGHPLDLSRVADLSSNHVREHTHLS